MSEDVDTRANNALTSTLNNQDKLCFRAETAKLLALNVAQIHSGLHEGESSIEQLGDSFQDLAGFCMKIQNSPDSDQPTKDLAQSVLSQVDSAIVSFQFYDRLTQRLAHVQDNLSLLSELLSDQARIDSIDDWRILRDKIKTSYSMETEQEMHEAIMSGASIDEALEIFKKKLSESNTEQVIEFF